MRNRARARVFGLTAWQGLFYEDNLHAGQRVLIHGGAGGAHHARATNYVAHPDGTELAEIRLEREHPHGKVVLQVTY